MSLVAGLISALIGAVWFMLNRRIATAEAEIMRLRDKGDAQKEALNTESKRQDDKRAELANRVFGSIEGIKTHDIIEMRKDVKDIVATDITEMRKDVKDLISTVNGLEGAAVTRKEMSEWCKDCEKGRSK